MKKLIYFFALIFVFGCSSSDDEPQTQYPNTSFHIDFDNVDYFGTIQRNNNDYLGWVWYWDNLDTNNQISSYTISANISQNQNNTTETPDDVFLTFSASNLQENQTYQLNGFEIYLESLTNGYWSCDTCTGTVTITDISTMQKTENLSVTTITGNFSISTTEYGLITGTFQNIPE